MKELDQQDSFDLLGVGLREDSYTELLANVLWNSPEFASTLYSVLVGLTPEEKAPTRLARVRTRVALRAEHKANVPDLCLRFDDPPTIWVIEMKIEANEGEGQTDRYFEHRHELLGPLDCDRDDDWDFAFTFLTLEDKNPCCGDFKNRTFADLLPVLPQDGSIPSKLQPLAQDLFRRLNYYYATRSGWSDEIGLTDYFGTAQGLVTERQLFYWLMEHAAENLMSNSKAEVALGRGNPLVRLWENSWVGPEYEESGGSAPLDQCFNVHIETQLVPRENPTSIALMLHFETNKYMTKAQLDSMPNDQRAEFEKQRAQFDDCLWRQPQIGGANMWKPTGKQARHQLAKCDPFYFQDANAADFIAWLRERVPVMKEAVSEALAEVC